MKIIAGSRKGAVLKGPRCAETRAVSSRIKESVFDILSDKTEGASVMDCFAGTGSFGLEALSRGAAGAVFIDSDPECAGLVRENLRLLGFEAEVYGCEAVEAFNKISGRGAKFDIIFLDPPFEEAARAAGPAMGSLGGSGLAGEGAVLVLRRHFKTAIPGTFGRFRLARRERYGENAVDFYVCDAGD